MEFWTNSGKKPPIRIIYIIGQLTYGGTELQLLELVSELNKDRFQPLVISLSNAAPLTEFFNEVGCGPIVLNREKKGRLLTLLSLAQILVNLRPEIIHTFGFSTRAALPLAKMLTNSKIIISLRTYPDWQTAWVDRLINGFADIIITNSKKALEYIKHTWPHVPSTVIYNGVDTKRFITVNKYETIVSPPVGTDLTSYCKKICVVARLDPVKRIDDILESFANVIKEYPNLQLWIVGDGPLKETLQNLVFELAINEKVVFWGTRMDIPVILSHCDIGLLVSSIEGLPNAVIEYMVSGLPVIATNVGGIPEIVVQEERGYLVEVGDIHALTETILALLKNPILAERMSLNAKEYVINNLTIHHMAKLTENLYEGVLGETK